MRNLGDVIKFVRESKGMTQEQLGEKIGVTGVTIMRYEKGQRRPDFETVRAIGDALGVSLLYISRLAEGDAIISEAEEYYKKAKREGSFYNTIHSVLEEVYGKAKEQKVSAYELKYSVYPNYGDPFALTEDDIGVICETAFSVIKTLTDNFRMTEQEAKEQLQLRAKETL